MKLFSCRSGGGWFLGLDAVTCIHRGRYTVLRFSDPYHIKISSDKCSIECWNLTQPGLWTCKWCAVMMSTQVYTGGGCGAGPGGHQPDVASLSPPGQRSSVLGPGGATTTNKNSRLKYQWVYFVFCKAFLLRCSCLYSRQFFFKITLSEHSKS